LGVKHTVYAGSFAVNGKQSNYGNRAVTEDDTVHGEYQYARHKIMNEWQALDYMEKFGLCITGIRRSARYEYVRYGLVRVAALEGGAFLPPQGGWRPRLHPFAAWMTNA
jgi:nucleoside-diphosphate-sugar epimerase